VVCQRVVQGVVIPAHLLLTLLLFLLVIKVTMLVCVLVVRVDLILKM
jgi:hypothetical protein